MPKQAVRKRTRQQKLKALANKRARYPDIVIGYWKDAMRERIEETRKLAGFKVKRGDCHSHSTYSDGIGTVPEIADWVEKAGLDFFFLTDHGTVRQKSQCVNYKNMWWGQEPGAQYHHLGILGLDRKFTPGSDLAADYNKVIALGGFPFIPHPTGWFPTRRSECESPATCTVRRGDVTIPRRWSCVTQRATW